MPALVQRSVGSPWGTSEELRTRRWPLLSKNLRKVSRILFPLHVKLGLSPLKSASIRKIVVSGNYRRGAYLNQEAVQLHSLRLNFAASILTLLACMGRMQA